MAFTEKQLGQGQISSVSATTLYTVPAATIGILRDLVITNTTGTAATISVWLVPNGGTAGDTNAILKTFNVPANDLVHFSMWQVLDTAGDTIQALAGTITAITITASGAEVA